MSIRKFQLNDLDQIMNIWLKSNLQAHPFIDEKYWKDHFADVSQALPQAEVIVAEENSKIVGFAGMQNDYLAGIFVEKEYRHQGIGNKLLQTIKKSHISITLNVYTDNKSAVNFYQHQKFRVVKEQEDETDHKEYVMEWDEQG